ncbi:MAG: hypothetical protein WEB03_03260 [Nitriliruptor sp.]
MPAQVDLDGGGEPAQVPPAVTGGQERGLRRADLGGEVGHPPFVGGLLEDHHARGVAGEGPVGERIDECEGGHDGVLAGAERGT